MASKSKLSNTTGPGLYEFLIEAELQQYFSALKTDLKVQTIAQLKYVSETDMSQIGMSRPEMRRLMKHFHKHCPQTYLGKMKKILRRRDDTISVPTRPSSSQSSSDRAVRAVAPGRHIIQADSIVVHKKLGSGEFGTVQQGVWTSDNGDRIQVAIKCLTQERMENNPVEFLKEASIMHSVDHEHIVRLYGVVLDTSAFMLVTELAPLRSLLECVQEPSMRPNLTVPTLFDFAIQICDGMMYLENKRLIHRDLASRNILVFSKSRVKISDFGLSRALGVGKDYYQTNFSVNLKLPIAWCAPECINYLKFTSASDVWAFGVVLWEIYSYGFQPWTALTGQQILEAIDEPNYQRLERPECCPSEIYYQIMLKCWQHQPDDRPTFVQLLELLPKCKPEQVQAIRKNRAKARRDLLEYEVGDIIVVLEKNSQSLCDDGDNALWKGVLGCGRTGLFSPTNTITYINSTLPSINQKRVPLKTSDYKSASQKNSLSTNMISKPQGDLKHTGHVGPDGEVFGDLGFLGTKWSVPKQVVAPYRAEPTKTETSRLRQSQNMSRDAEIPCNDTAPLLSTSSEISDDGKSRRKPVPPSLILGLPSTEHEYHEISGDERELTPFTGATTGLSNPALSYNSQSPLDSPGFEKSFEHGPSLVDEVFEALQEDITSETESRHRNANEHREILFEPKRIASVKPISSSDRKTLDQAIAIANELASRSMLDLDCSTKHSRKNHSLDDISARSPDSPAQRRKFLFLRQEREKRNYCEEAASIPDIQSTLSEEAKEVYNSLIEKNLPGTSGFLTPSFQNKSSTFHFPPKSSSLNKQFSLLEDSSVPQIHKPHRSLSLDQDETSRGAKNKSQTIQRYTRRTRREEDDQEIENEKEQNPLRLLRTNKSNNVLPLPPRERKHPPSATLNVRHQRKHQLLIPGIPISAIASSTERRTLPPKPPAKPQRQNINDKSTNEKDDNDNKCKNTPSNSPKDQQSCDTTDASGSLSSPVQLYENFELEDGGSALSYGKFDNDLSVMTQTSLNISEVVSTLEAQPRVNFVDSEDSDAPRPNDSNDENRGVELEPATSSSIQEESTVSNYHVKAKIVQRILGARVTDREANWALDITDGDAARAVKLLRLKELLPESLLKNHTQRVLSVLIDVHWDVGRASDFLLDNRNNNSISRITMHSDSISTTSNLNFNTGTDTQRINSSNFQTRDQTISTDDLSTEPSNKLPIRPTHV